MRVTSGIRSASAALWGSWRRRVAWGQQAAPRDWGRRETASPRNSRADWCRARPRKLRPRRTGTCHRHRGFRDLAAGLEPGRNGRANRRRQESRHEQRRHRPGQEAVRRVAEEHLVGMHGDPTRTQPARKVSTQCRGQQLHDSDPDDGGDAGRGAGNTARSPRAKRPRGRDPCPTGTARATAPLRRRRPRLPHPRKRAAFGSGCHGDLCERWAECAAASDEMQERLTLVCRCHAGSGCSPSGGATVVSSAPGYSRPLGD